MDSDIQSYSESISKHKYIYYIENYIYVLTEESVLEKMDVYIAVYL